MRVLHIYGGFLFGGIENMLVTMARSESLAPGLRQEFALCHRGRLWRELSVAGVPLHDLGNVRVSRPWSMLRAGLRLGRLLRRHRFDCVVIHSAWSHAIFSPRFRRARLPLIFWLHDRASGGHWTERWAARTPPDLAICNSRFTLTTLPAIFPHTPAEVLYCPVTDTIPHLAPRERAAVRAQFQVQPDELVIVIACRLEAWKGHQLLLAALHNLPAEAQAAPWKLWIIGGVQRPSEQIYADELRRQAESQLPGRVQFLGQRDDVPRLYAAADLHCQPNLQPEPFGIAWVEALYAGLPVITTALGGALEIITAGCGVLVPAGDAGALTAALARLMRDPVQRRNLSAHGPARAAELSSPALLMPRFLQILETALRWSSAGELSSPVPQ